MRLTSPTICFVSYLCFCYPANFQWHLTNLQENKHACLLSSFAPRAHCRFILSLSWIIASFFLHLTHDRRWDAYPGYLLYILFSGYSTKLAASYDILCGLLFLDANIANLYVFVIHAPSLHLWRFHFPQSLSADNMEENENTFLDLESSLIKELYLEPDDSRLLKGFNDNWDKCSTYWDEDTQKKLLQYITAGDVRTNDTNRVDASGHKFWQTKKEEMTWAIWPYWEPIMGSKSCRNPSLK